MSYKPKLNQENIEKAILELGNLDLQAVTISELENLLLPLFYGYKISAPQFEPNEIMILRGRKCDKPKYFHEVTYPKAEYINTYGRLNDIGQSMFYGSIGRTAPFKELGCEVDDTLIIGVWNIIDTMLLNHVGFTKKTGSALKSKRDLQNIYEFVKTTSGYDDLNTFVYNYLADIFTWIVPPSKNYLYKLSNAIANKLLMGNTFSGLMYPSITLYGNSDNIALKPTFADNSLELIAVEYLQITSVENDTFQYDILDTATEINDQGEILWTGRLLTWSSKGNFSAKNNGESWIPYDESGKRINAKSNGDLIDKLTKLEKYYKRSEDHIFKVSANLNVNVGVDPNNLDVVNAYVTLKLNVKNKEKSLSFYIPDTPYCIIILNNIIGSYNSYLNIDKGNLIEMRNANDNDISYSNLGSHFNNSIEVYSERKFDTTELLTFKPAEINLLFFFGDTS